MAIYISLLREHVDRASSMGSLLTNQLTIEEAFQDRRIPLETEVRAHDGYKKATTSTDC